MPKLDWIGKDKVINHHQEIPIHSIVKQYQYNNDDDNMIIHGDNLLGLKALLPKYEGQIDVITIDPPYNTGAEKWVYNDNVNHPKIAKWLNEVVGPESEDLSRHDKWLCMMYPRLQLLKKLLKPSGVIFINIDDNELAHLKLICDEIFGSSNFCGQFMWYKSATPPNLSYKIKKNLEYILCYEKEKDTTRFVGRMKSSPSNDPLIKPQNAIKKLLFKAGTIHFKGVSDKTFKAGVYGTIKYPQYLLNDLIVENELNKNDVYFENRFIWIQSTLEEQLKTNTKIYASNKLVLSYKKNSYSPEVPPNLIDSSVNVNTTEEAGKELDRMFNQNKVFEYPKDVSLIEYLIQFKSNKDSIILDSFAGSGTTAHAILNLNKKDNGKRRFILIELMDYAETLTVERVKKVIDGYNDTPGTGGGFSFYKLGPTIFDDLGNLNSDISTDDIRKYIYYTLTKSIPENDKDNKYFLGSHNFTDYYFYYEKNQITTLNHDFLNSINKKSEQYIIYADKCSIDESYLNYHKIIFKKIPRDITKL